MEKTSKYQQLSLREAGQFDRKFLTFDGTGEVTSRQITSGWTAVSQDRHTRGLSRKARIARSKG